MRAAITTVLLIALAAITYSTTNDDREGPCIDHVRQSGVEGAQDHAEAVCKTDYINRFK